MGIKRVHTIMWLVICSASIVFNHKLCKGISSPSSKVSINITPRSGTIKVNTRPDTNDQEKRSTPTKRKIKIIPPNVLVEPHKISQELQIVEDTLSNSTPKHKIKVTKAN